MWNILKVNNNNTVAEQPRYCHVDVFFDDFVQLFRNCYSYFSCFWACFICCVDPGRLLYTGLFEDMPGLHACTKPAGNLNKYFCGNLLRYKEQGLLETAAKNL